MFMTSSEIYNDQRKFNSNIKKVIEKKSNHINYAQPNVLNLGSIISAQNYIKFMLVFQGDIYHNSN